jgi:hypothetical protein
VRTEPTDPLVLKPIDHDDPEAIRDPRVSVFSGPFDRDKLNDPRWPVQFTGDLIQVDISPLTLPDGASRVFDSLGSKEVDLGRDGLIEHSSHYYTNAYEDVLTLPAPGAFRIVVGKFGDADLKIFRGIPDQELTSGRVISVQVPVDAFVHTQTGAVVMLSAKMADGSSLPAWLTFDPSTGKFRGTAPVGTPDEIAVIVEARDGDGRQADAVFRIKLVQGKVAGRAGLSDQLRAAARETNPYDVLRRLQAPAARTLPPSRAA